MELTTTESVLLLEVIDQHLEQMPDTMEKMIEDRTTFQGSSGLMDLMDVAADHAEREKQLRLIRQKVLDG